MVTILHIRKLRLELGSLSTVLLVGGGPCLTYIVPLSHGTQATPLPSSVTHGFFESTV